MLAANLSIFPMKFYIINAMRMYGNIVFIKMFIVVEIHIIPEDFRLNIIIYHSAFVTKIM